MPAWVRRVLVVPTLTRERSTAVSSWNPFSWDFWTGGSEPKSPGAARVTHQQVVAQGHSAAAHQEVASGQRTQIHMVGKTRGDAHGS